MKYFKKYEHIITLILSLVALIISAIAIFQSSKANDIARKSYNLSKKQYISESLLTLSGDFTNQTDYIMLKTTNPNHILQQVKILFPSELDELDYPIKTSKFKIPTQNLRVKLIEDIEKKFLKDINTTTVGLIESVTPIVIQCYYVLKGKKYFDLSLYLLYHRTIIGKETISSNLAFTKLVFIKRLENNDNPKRILNDIWERNQTPNKTE